MLGLAFGSGPIPGGQHVVSACSCCPLPDATPCCSTDEGPISDAPLSAPTVSALKSALVPVRVLLGIAPTVVAETTALSLHRAASHSAPERLALLCTRLI
jgi:hypothetical protein